MGSNMREYYLKTRAQLEVTSDDESNAKENSRELLVAKFVQLSNDEKKNMLEEFRQVRELRKHHQP